MLRAVLCCVTCVLRAVLLRVSPQVPIRGDVHVLIVGDPGMGKSQMLQVGGGL